MRRLADGQQPPLVAPVREAHPEQGERVPSPLRTVAGQRDTSSATATAAVLKVSCEADPAAARRIQPSAVVRRDRHDAPPRGPADGRRVERLAELVGRLDGRIEAPPHVPGSYLSRRSEEYSAAVDGSPEPDPEAEQPLRAEQTIAEGGESVTFFTPA